MKFQTFTIVCGTTACQASCPMCISAMTPTDGLAPQINWRNFKIAKELAKKSGVSTVMITGKGEPTLWVATLDSYIENLQGFPIIELQTNGIGLTKFPEFKLQNWYDAGLTTIVISICHWKDERNKEIYLHHRNEAYPPLVNTVKLLHDIGFSVRLNCILLKDYVALTYTVEELIAFAKKNGVEQLTLMPVNAPKESKNEGVANWVAEHKLSTEQLTRIENMLDTDGTPLMDLAHGARVFDYKGQNVCLSNCLSTVRYRDESVMRNLIFMPDGHLRYDWQHTGAIIL